MRYLSQSSYGLVRSPSSDQLNIIIIVHCHRSFISILNFSLIWNEWVVPKWFANFEENLHSHIIMNIVTSWITSDAHTRFSVTFKWDSGTPSTYTSYQIINLTLTLICPSLHQNSLGFGNRKYERDLDTGFGSSFRDLVLFLHWFRGLDTLSNLTYPNLSIR